MNSFKRVRAFQIELEFGSVGFWGEGKTGVSGEKPLGAKERTSNKLNPHMAPTPGVQPGPHCLRDYCVLDCSECLVEVIIKKKNQKKNQWHQYKAKSQEVVTQKLIEVLNSFYVYFFFWKATKLKYGGIPNIFDKTVQIPLVAHTTSWGGFSIRFTRKSLLQNWSRKVCQLNWTIWTVRSPSFPVGLQMKRVHLV